MVSFFAESDAAHTPFEQCVVLIASVSLGNVPQLAADVVLANLPSFNRIGFIGDGSTSLPFVGAAEAGAGGGGPGSIVTGGLEVLGSSEHSLVVVQQRSPTIKSKKDQHARLIADFVNASKFRFALVLTSVDAANQDDSQLQTPLQSILPPSSNTPSQPVSSSTRDMVSRLEAIPGLSLSLGQPNAFASLQPHPQQGGSSASPASAPAPYPPFIPGGGSTRRLLGALHEARVPHGALAAWCAEGDNREDAKALAHCALGIVGVSTAEDRLSEPRSWRGLFGSTNGWSGGAGQDSEIYG